jgi:hypothetical protein
VRPPFRRRLGQRRPGSDLGGREHCCRYLIKKRLKEMMVCSLNQNELDGCLAKGFCCRQTAEAPTNNHHAPCARIPGVSFDSRDTISVRHCSVLFSHLFLKLLGAEISENPGFSRGLLR